MSDGRLRGRASTAGRARCHVVVLGLLLIGALGADEVADRRTSLAHALWQHQRPDGSWRSDTYALLRSGQALTAVMLAGLLDDPVDAPPEAVERGLASLRGQVGPDGSVGSADPLLLEYPTYATSFALLAFARAGRAEDADRRARLVHWLRRCQRSEADGFSATHVAYGGWGFTLPLRPGEAGHVDLAHTRWALTALAAAGALDDQTRQRASVYLALVQRRDRSRLPADAPDADGGCFFTPVAWPANKGGDGRPGHPWSASYASATADGAVALQLIGEPEHAALAQAWLRDHDAWAWPAGVPHGEESWGDAMRFYHCAARAAAWRGQTGSWRDHLLAVLGSPREDGLYANGTGFLMKEDDPLVASGLALLALTAAAASPLPPDNRQASR